MKKTQSKSEKEIKETIIDSLIYSPLFDGLIENELKVVADHMDYSKIETGDILFREGDRGDSVCFVLEGVVDIIKESSPGSEVVIASLPKGRSIGEMSVIDNFPRSATAKARRETTLLTLTQKNFDEILKNNPEIGIKILKGISRLLSLNLRKTSSRLADYLLPVS
ncbi:MAG: cyclic nucleotide-binding domain-containing protein [Desulfobacterales bacterium]|uniref:Cyclic nucleotide-binding domain-containing protein n=1 Tax=Candidatus Desulfatibia vada TaxID=2841696 RepID=A0A8J6NT69_9BACT|nr:cyclic nucleotide-binding domain-containing protein [Candidatus Desulfatibia vada]MBL6971883.1 cyclic nucleotide-binding domain-containing protein [Desulfobacterales bacterium]